MQPFSAHLQVTKKSALTLLISEACIGVFVAIEIKINNYIFSPTVFDKTTLSRSLPFGTPISYHFARPAGGRAAVLSFTVNDLTTVKLDSVDLAPTYSCYFSGSVSFPRSQFAIDEDYL